MFRQLDATLRPRGGGRRGGAEDEGGAGGVRDLTPGVSLTVCFKDPLITPTALSFWATGMHRTNAR